MTSPERFLPVDEGAPPSRGDWGNLKFELVDDEGDDGGGMTEAEAREFLARPIAPVRSSTQTKEG